MNEIALLAAPLAMFLKLFGLILMIGGVFFMGKGILDLLSSIFAAHSAHGPVPAETETSTSPANSYADENVPKRSSQKSKSFRRAPVSGGVRTIGKPTEPQVDWVTGRRLS